MRGWLPLALTALLASNASCRDNACEARPAEAQIDIRMRSLPADALLSEVTLRVNDGPALTRTFSSVRSLGFAFEFGALDRPPQTLTVEVAVYAADGRLLASGHLATDFVSNGCNFFSVDVVGLGGDGGPADGGVGDVPDLWPAPPDVTTPDLADDAAPPDDGAPADTAPSLDVSPDSVAVDGASAG